MDKNTTLYIEDQIRASRATHEGKIAELVKDAIDRPGYYSVGIKNLFTLDAEQRAYTLAWIKAANEAVRTGKVQRGINGKFYPNGHALPTVFDILAAYSDLYVALAWFGGFVAMFLVTMTQGPVLIAAMGWLGYVCTGAGIVMSFVIACAFHAWLNR